MTIETVRLSQKAKEQLAVLKRRTGIKNWNVLCRWALCLSVAEKTPPSAVNVGTDTAVEMTWKVFGGPYHGVYLALLKERCHGEGLPTDDETLATQLRLHVHRGISYLSANRKLRSVADLVSLSSRSDDDA